MSGFDIISLSLRNLLRRKTRTVLAVIGVIIGICAIIVMLSIDFALQEGFRASVEKWGNLHLVTVYQGSGHNSGAEQSAGVKAVKLDDKAIINIENIPGVTAVTPREVAWLNFLLDGYVVQGVSVVGIRPEVLEKFNYNVKEGRLLRQSDKESLLFGNQIPGMFYNPRKTWGVRSNSDKAPVDVMSGKIGASADWTYGQPPTAVADDSEKVTYNEYSFRGVGVMENPDDYDTAYNVYTHIDTVKKINEDTARAEKRNYDRNAGYQQAMVYVEDIDDVRAVSDSIRAMGLQTDSLTDALDVMQGQARMIQAVLGGISAVSLLVATLGIANTMIMSIYERTREIGVMKVIGANLPDIRSLFLVEAAMIGFAGGLIGVFLSYLLSVLMNTTLLSVISGVLSGMSYDRISIIPLWLPLAALAFSTMIGVAAGYSPARRAMGLSALESLRNE